MAQDTGGAKAAGPWITAAKPEYTALVDEQQIITQKYGMVNVPTAVWIDEQGRIVRPNEVAFIDDRFKSFTNMESAPYIEAIRDWAANGAKSVYVLSEAESKARLARFRAEAIHAGFKDAWARRDFDVIVSVGARLPQQAYEQDEQLLFYYDNARKLKS